MTLTRARQAAERVRQVVNGAGEHLPFASRSFDLILSHEVLEHVADDRAAMVEMARVLRRGGRAVIFTPNRGYPFETHGIYWRGRYHFGNMPLVNYLPRAWRNRLVPHVRAYSARDMQVVDRQGCLCAWSNARSSLGPTTTSSPGSGSWGDSCRTILQGLERTPLQVLGLSHFWVVEKI